MLEVVEGQVGDQVSGVPDEGRRTPGDVGGGQSFAVPQAKCQTLVKSHAPQVSVNSFPPEESKNYIFKFDLTGVISWNFCLR